MTRRGTLPLADAPLLAAASRRTRLVRIVLVAVLAGALAVGGLIVASGSDRASAAGGAAKNTIVVLDLSGSVSGDAYLRVGTLLRSLAAHRDGARVGLVLFSDIAQVALPAGASATALAGYVRFFRPMQPKHGTPQSMRTLVNPYPDNPWMPSFSRGTVISRGLALARRIVAQAHLRSARVLLVSDLFDAASDISRLRTELLAYARTRGVELRVMPLAPFSDDTMRMFETFLGDRDVRIEPSEPASLARAGAASSFPVAFVAIVGALALALAANELVGAPFRWREGEVV
jgi:hypothetical protein